MRKLSLSTKLPHEKIRRNFGIFRSATDGDVRLGGRILVGEKACLRDITTFQYLVHKY